MLSSRRWAVTTISSSVLPCSCACRTGLSKTMAAAARPRITDVFREGFLSIGVLVYLVYDTFSIDWIYSTIITIFTGAKELKATGKFCKIKA